MQKTPDFMPEFRANLPRTSHVLSHDFHFTASTAHLLPVFHTIVSPGDTIKIGFNFNLRTMPLEAAAFADLVCHTEYFFVPFSLLYQPFDSVYYGITDQFTSLFTTSQLARNFPVLDFDDCISRLYSQRSVRSGVGLNTSMTESVGQNAIRFLDMLGYNPIGVACEDSEEKPFVNAATFPYPILAYNCIYQYYYRLDARETFDQNSFNFDRFYQNAASQTAVPYTSYNPLKYLQLRYRPLGNDYFTDVKVSPIVDVLNLANKSTLSSVNSWLARNTNVSPDAASVNSGIFTTFKQVFAGQNDGTSGAIYSSPAGDNLSKAAFMDGDTPEQVYVNGKEIDTNKFALGIDSVDDLESVGLQVRTPHNHGFSVLGQQINTANIRAMFANEKLWSITGRAKKNYDDQTLAHFGYKVPHDVKHQICCFGHDVSKIHIGEVISTSDTTGAPLGEIAGKGYGVQNVQQHSFTAPCHGVIMAIFSVVCERNYDGGILRENIVVDSSDLFQPEYDHLGMQPLFAYEANYFDNSSADYSVEVYGWQYRYEQWKRRYNRVSGAFRNITGTLRSWVPTFTPYIQEQTALSRVKDGNLANTESFKYFINYPTDVNQIFLAQYPSQWSTAFEGYNKWAHIYDYDPFVIAGNLNCVLVSSMSDYSLPRLDA